MVSMGARLPTHVAFIPDGNRRFARGHRMEVEDAYQAGARKGVEAVGWCVRAGVRHISTYASSVENMARRPAPEMKAVHRAVAWFCTEVRRQHQVTVHLVGDVEGVSPGLSLDGGAGCGPEPVVHVAVNYCVDADLACGPAMGSAAVPLIDLVVRTGGQRRLSGLFPIQSRFAELWFCDTPWPAFREDEFRAALAWYAEQERRWGE